MAFLEYRDLTKSYGSTIAVRNLNLDINPGRIIGLLGPNGSGKTTLIKMTAGILTPSTGEIRVNGYQIGTETKNMISYLPERTYLNELMTIDETIDFFADFYEDFNKYKAYDMISRLGLDRGARIKTLSKGTKEKVQLMLVMSRDAKLYLLDEPIAGVDPAARDYILNTVISNYAKDASVIISTHLIADVEAVIDDVLFLSYGTVILSGSAEQIRNETGKTIDELFREKFRC